MSVPDWPRAWGEPPVSAQLRASPADFFVEEDLGLEPEGAGEHVWLWIEKENLNTNDAAQRLARFAGLRERDISYAGLKDKRAITRQWFSLHLINREVDWSQWGDPALRILRVARHHRKLRRGAHRGNRFELVLRGMRGDVNAFLARLDEIVRQGVPNYFGEQRFGRDGRNSDGARNWVAKGCPRLPRHQLSLYLSALRSDLFNRVLGARVAAGNWREPLAGEVFMLDGSGSVFRETVDAALRQRIIQGDVHLTGPLPGRAASLAPEAEVAALEQSCLAEFAPLIDALARAGVDAARRSLRLIPGDWQCEFIGAEDWRLRFTLPKGCFATVLVRELALLDTTPVESTNSNKTDSLQE